MHRTASVVFLAFVLVVMILPTVFGVTIAPTDVGDIQAPADSSVVDSGPVVTSVVLPCVDNAGVGGIQVIPCVE